MASGDLIVRVADKATLDNCYTYLQELKGLYEEGVTGDKLAITTAGEADVLSGKTFYSVDNVAKVGTMTGASIGLTPDILVKGNTVLGVVGENETTVEGLAAENIVAGQTVTVRQGAKVVAQVTGSNGENKLGLLAYIPLSKNTTYNYPVEAPKITQGILDESYFAIQNDALVCLKSCKVKITAYTVLGGTSEAINNPAANEAYISLNGSRLLSCNVGEGDGTWYGSYVLYKRYDTTTMTLKSGDKITRGAESYWVFPPEILIEQA